MPSSVISIVNGLAGETGVKAADIVTQDEMATKDRIDVEERFSVHAPTNYDMVDNRIDMSQDDFDPDLPELEERVENEDDSDNEREDDNDEIETADFLGDGGESALKELYDILEEESLDSGAESTVHQPPLRRSERTTAGVKVKDDSYDWSLMNLSVAAALHEFGQVAKDARQNELVQLFTEKQALFPVRWESLNARQRKKVVRSHMFLREKYEDGNFVKMKARLVADERMQDRNVYNDYSSPTAKTQSVMMCLKLAAVKGWDLTKLDVGGAFLCANMDDTEEVHMILDKQLSGMCAEWIPEAKECLRDDGKLVVKVNRAMYGLIQSAKLWYKELSGCFINKGFKIVKGDDCVLVKRMENG
jgi:hypothetical protein